jgi:hypothetical protein
MRPVAKVGTSAAAYPGRGENNIRGHAEEPGGILRQNHFFSQEPQKVAVRLSERGPAAAQNPGLNLTHEAGEERRQQKHEEHLQALNAGAGHYLHNASTSKRNTRAEKTKLR